MNKLTRLLPLCYFYVQVSSVCVRVPAARRSTEVSTDLSLRGKTQRWCMCLCVCVWEYSTCSLCVYSEGWSDPHTMCPVSVATNWISLDSQCWADRSVVEDRLFNISVAFTGQLEHRESYGDQPGADVFNWHHSLICSAASTHSVSFQSHSCPFWVPHVLLRSISLRCSSWGVSLSSL